MRHTVSSLGAFAEEEDDGVAPVAALELELELEPELQPAMASAAAAQAAAAVILCRTAGVLLARLRFGVYRRN
jgi:hypothetical protein